MKRHPITTSEINDAARDLAEFAALIGERHAEWTDEELDRLLAQLGSEVATVRDLACAAAEAWVAGTSRRSAQERSETATRYGSARATENMRMAGFADDEIATAEELMDFDIERWVAASMRKHCGDLLDD